MKLVTLYLNVVYELVVIHIPTISTCTTNRKVAGSIPDSVIGIFH
jgi:hypothetical protein